MPRVAIRTIRGRRKFAEYPEVKKQMGDYLDKTVKPELLALFDARVANWKNKVAFEARKFINAERIAVNVFPSNSTPKGKEIFGYVSGGTTPHKIRVRNARTLVFMWGGPGSYVPKTTTSGGFGGPGAVVGGEIHRPLEVNHPGNEPRDIPKKILVEYRPTFSAGVESNWRRILRAL